MKGLIYVLFDENKYPTLAAYTKPIVPPKRPTMGRKNEMKAVIANLERPEISNVILLGPAGSGKTAIVNEVARRDVNRTYLEVDLALMSSSDGGNTDGSVEMAGRMKRLVNEVEAYQDAHKGHDLVLFMDEFHQIAIVSTAALQAVKPLLAESGRRHVKIIAATTFEEFNQYIKGDEALTERLQRITVSQVSHNTVLSILDSMRTQHGHTLDVQAGIFEQIIDLTNRYAPSQAQPRKSIRVFDAMLGWHNAFDMPLNRNLLNQVMFESYGVQANWSVDVHDLVDYLNSRVIDQHAATKALASRLYMSVAGLNDDSRPQGSFLFTGSTGVGKTEMAKALADKLFNGKRGMIRFDMSEYADDNTVNTFRERLANDVSDNPYSIVLLDEIEKSSPKVTRLLLQVLDDAELSDKYGREVSFVNNYIILTTNQAQSVYKSAASYLDSDDDKKSSQGLKEYTKLIRRALLDSDNFPTELVNRLDGFIPFAPLKRSTRQKIAALRLKELIQQVKTKQGTTVHMTSDVMKYLVAEHVDDSTDNGGGRGIKRKIDDDITAPIARLLVLHPGVQDIAVTVVGDFAVDNKYDRIGTAEIKVGIYDDERADSE